jgi:hypothetical protein
MSPEEKARLRELPSLIANERDPEKIKVLAVELEELMIADGKWLRATKETAKQLTRKGPKQKAASFLLPVSPAALVLCPSFAPVSLAPMGRLGFPTQQQPRRLSGTSITNECDGRIKIPFENGIVGSAYFGLCGQLLL